MNDPNQLSIIEAFNSLQGEGRNIGMPCTFLRLAYCNLRCVWCDTKYSWDWKNYDPAAEVKDHTIQEVAEIVTQWHAKNLVISGGEPLLQQYQIVRLLDYLGDSLERSQLGPHIVLPFEHVEVETAGTILPTDALISRINLFNVSPKLENSGNTAAKRFRQAALDKFAELALYNKAIFKFVVTSASDYGEIDEMVSTLKIPAFAVYIMPEGITEAALTEHAREVAQGAIERGYRVTTRLHVLLFGNKRGV